MVKKKKKYSPSNLQQEAGWPYQHSQDLAPKSKRAEVVIDHVKHINPTTRRNPHVWIWNDASINSSGLIIVANIHKKDVYMKKQVIEVLERSGLSQNYINIQSIKICRWRAYIQLKNPKDVVKLNRFSKVRYPDTPEGSLVYIVHTPRRAFMKSGNWPLDMLFVIYHDKLKTEYHDILDYTKTIPGDLYFAIAAMVKLSESKTVVVLYRRCKDFDFLAKAPCGCGINKVMTPTAEDLCELTAILNGKDLDPAKGWKFVRKTNLNPVAKTFYTSNPTPQDLSQQAHQAPYALSTDVSYYPAPGSGFRSRWAPGNLEHLSSAIPSPWGSGPFVAPSNVEARLRLMELTSPGGWGGAEHHMISPRLLISPASSIPPRQKTIRHILTPLNEVMASQNPKHNTPTKNLEKPTHSNPVASADWSKLVKEARVKEARAAKAAGDQLGSQLSYKPHFVSSEGRTSLPKKSPHRARGNMRKGLRPPVRHTTIVSSPPPPPRDTETKPVKQGRSKPVQQRVSSGARRLRAGTPESSGTSSDVSRKDVQSSNINSKGGRPSRRSDRRSERIRASKRIKNYPS